MKQRDILQLMLDALIETRAVYLRALSHKMSYFAYRMSNDIKCPLCETSKVINKKYLLSGCEECPWKVIRGVTCLTLKDAMTRSSADSKAILGRIGELDNWILIYEGKLSSCL